MSLDLYLYIYMYRYRYKIFSDNFCHSSSFAVFLLKHQLIARDSFPAKPVWGTFFRVWMLAGSWVPVTFISVTSWIH